MGRESGHDGAGTAEGLPGHGHHGTFHAGARSSGRGRAWTSKARGVLHYVKAVKPWSPDAMLRWAWDPGSTPAASAFRFWYDAWLDVLAQAHLRTGVLGQAGWTFA